MAKCVTHAADEMELYAAVRAVAVCLVAAGRRWMSLFSQDDQVLDAALTAGPVMGCFIGEDARSRCVCVYLGAARCHCGECVL